MESKRAELPVRVRDDEQMTEKRVGKKSSEGEGSERAAVIHRQASRHMAAVCRALGRSQEHCLVTRWCCMSQPEQSKRDTWKQKAPAHLFPLIEPARQTAEIYIRV